MALVMNKITDSKIKAASLSFYFDFESNEFVVKETVKLDGCINSKFTSFAKNELHNDGELLNAMYEAVGQRGKALEPKFASSSVLLDSLKNNGAFIFVTANVDKDSPDYGVISAHRLLKEVKSFDYNNQDTSTNQFSDVFAGYFMQYQKDFVDVPNQ